MKGIIWEHKVKVMGEHILYKFCFQHVKAESCGGMTFFPCLSSWTSQIASVIPTVASPANSSLWAHQHDTPKGKPRSSPFCWSLPEQGRMMYIICHYLLSRSETCRAAFSLTGRSLFLPGIWHCFLSPAAFHQRRSVGQNRTCKQGGDALQKEKADLRNIWISKVSGLMSWASWSYKAVSPYSAILQASCSPLSQGGEKSENNHHHWEKKYVSCLASVKIMGINRMMLLHRWWVNKVGLTWPQIFGILMYFLIL